MQNESRPAAGDGTTETITLGGGCFWCLDPIFDPLEGVREVVVGYAGGQTADPTYREVCSGATGHAEVVQVTFDPQVISFEEILRIFFAFHDPTTLNRQGNDVGTQYRSAIFYHDDTQRQVAQALIAELDGAGLWDAPIVTEIAPLQTFYAAEDYHQKYFEKNPAQGYCQVIIAPKVAKLRAHFAERLRLNTA